VTTTREEGQRRGTEVTLSRLDTIPALKEAEWYEQWDIHFKF